MKQVLITGASGFVGGQLVKSCLAKGWQVRAFVLPGDPGAAILKELGATVFEGDIRDKASVMIACVGCQIVFHAAAVVTDWAPKQLFDEVTVGGTRHVCEGALAAGVERLVKVSTNDVFGLDESEVMDETFPMRSWHEPYSDAKMAAEEIAWTYHREKGLPVTMVYPCWVFGPGDRTFVPLLADAIIHGEMVYLRKNAIVWPTYIENLADLLLLIAEHPAAVGNGYLVHDGESTTLEHFCKEIAKVMGVKPPKWYIPYRLAMLAGWLMELVWRLLGKKSRPLLTTYTVKNLGSRLRFSIAKAEKELGWKPPVPFKEGMARTMDWLKILDRNTFKQK